MLAKTFRLRCFGLLWANRFDFYVTPSPTVKCQKASFFWKNYIMTLRPQQEVCYIRKTIAVFNHETQRILGKDSDEKFYTGRIEPETKPVQWLDVTSMLLWHEPTYSAVTLAHLTFSTLCSLEFVTLSPLVPVSCLSLLVCQKRLTLAGRCRLVRTNSDRHETGTRGETVTTPTRDCITWKMWGAHKSLHS